MTDLEVIQNVLSGQLEFFDHIVNKYQKQLNIVVSRYVKDVELAQDIVQDSFIKVYKNLHKFEGRCSFKNWIYKVTLNTAKNKIRSLKYHDDIDNTVISQACMIEEKLMYKEIKQRLIEMVATLPEKQKLSVELRIFSDLSFKQIAEQMSCPYDTAKANYRHALLKIKTYFQEDLAL